MRADKPNTHRRIPPELSALIQSLKTEQRAKVEALFETALASARQRRIADLWEQPELSSSYWILLVSGMDEAAEIDIADVILKWKAFFVRDSASVLSFQSSDREAFRCCAKAFEIVACPALILGHSPDMLEYLRFERRLLCSLRAQRNALHRFLTSLQILLERTGSLSEVREQLSADQFWADLGLVPSDAKALVSIVAHEPDTFDTFLSHNSRDRPGVLRLARALRARGVKVWLDEWQLVPGRPWQDALETIIGAARSALVVVGEDGLGPWEVPEVRACISEFVERRMPVIPVLLPGLRQAPDLPLFLRQFTWVDLRKGLTREAMERLERGIRESDSLTRRSRRRPRAGRA